MTDTIIAERPWTIEAIDRLRELAVAKVPAELISQNLQRPVAAVRQKAAELGLALEVGGRA
ncbi:hypothetical protein [Prosthecomicrobium pneumaticum]|uniref:Uncharacterized protein n=1 Tax=Prosthecomicrobium pneumaticum TaxID=81895 RepID=A0A7W9L2J4_9HYPH|nr:hypothetical protein [Prosthecomicrobium pneumaticum]MBB5753605.1 hypothetical protein [Prosthecomicrobium pneumaticum]